MHWRDIKKEKPEWGERVLGYFPDNEIRPFACVKEPEHDDEMTHWMRLEKPDETVEQFMKCFFCNENKDLP